MPLSSVLPARPNLEHLRNQAKDLLKAYRSGDPSAIARFRESLPRYSDLTDDDLARLSLSLGDAQRVVATEYGFSGWLQMRQFVERKDGADMIEMTVDHVRVNNVTNLRTVVLKEKGSDRYLTIWIGQAEGDSIALKLQGQTMPRPLTHDLMDSMIRDMGGTVTRVAVSEMVDDTFIAVITLKIGESYMEIDSRPSDAIALAVRCDAPVFASQEVIDRAGVELDPETGEFSAPGSGGRGIAHLHGGGEVSERFRAALEMAGMNARSMARNEIEPEDMLLALINDADCSGNKALVGLGADLERIRSRLQSQTARGNSPLELSARSRRVMELAKSEAEDGVVGTEHLLMGLALLDDGLASEALRESGVALGAARRVRGELED